jgi:hypothetical protein
MQNFGIWVSRLAAASLIGLVGVSAVQAQNAVLNFQPFDGATSNTTFIGNVWSQFKFTESMSVTSIGFVWSSNVINVNDEADFTWSLNGNHQGSIGRRSLTQGANNIGWWDLTSGVQVNAGDTIQIYNQGTFNGPMAQEGNYAYIDSVDPLDSSVQGVTYEGMTENGVFGTLSPYKTNGNIKVQNPGSNVAPEPGTFALALTGGGALLGICIRRRRMAA